MIAIENNREITLLDIKGKTVEIDDGCVPLVEYFNSIGLDTKYCCEGHKVNEPFYIMFEDYIADEEVFNFIGQYSTIYNHSPFLGKFMKWCRKMSSKIALNWVYVANTQERADIDYMRMTSDEFKI